MQPISSFAFCGSRASGVLREDVAVAGYPTSAKECHLQLIFPLNMLTVLSTLLHFRCRFGTSQEIKKRSIHR
jgi:hypothetical protein